MPPGDRGAPAAQRALADDVRALVVAALLTTEEPENLDRARTLVQEATRRLEGSSRSSRYEGGSSLSAGITEANDAIWETHAAFGASNPLAPPVRVTETPGRVEGSVTFAPSYEGGPGLVYGGFIAAAFDGMLGRAVISSGRLGVTRSLTVRYRRPTPLSTALRIEATTGQVEGRNVEVNGRLWNGDELTCEAEAVFTTVGEGQYRIDPERPS